MVFLQRLDWDVELCLITEIWWEWLIIIVTQTIIIWQLWIKAASWILIISHYVVWFWWWDCWGNGTGLPKELTNCNGNWSCEQWVGSHLVQGVSEGDWKIRQTLLKR
jgi:hypothetical protein